MNNDVLTKFYGLLEIEPSIFSDNLDEGIAISYIQKIDNIENSQRKHFLNIINNYESNFQKLISVYTNKDGTITEKQRRALLILISDDAPYLWGLVSSGSQNSTIDLSVLADMLSSFSKEEKIRTLIKYSCALANDKFNEDRDLYEAEWFELFKQLKNGLVIAKAVEFCAPRAVNISGLTHETSATVIEPSEPSFSLAEMLVLSRGTNRDYDFELPKVARSQFAKRGKAAADARFDKARGLAFEIAADYWVDYNQNDPPKIGHVIGEIRKIIGADLDSLGLKNLPQERTVRGWIDSAIPESLKR